MQPFPTPDTPIKRPIMRTNRIKMSSQNAANSMAAVLDRHQFFKRFVPVYAFSWISFPVASAHSWLAASATVCREEAEH
jgi:hypothetical protein